MNYHIASHYVRLPDINREAEFDRNHPMMQWPTRREQIDARNAENMARWRVRFLREPLNDAMPVAWLSMVEQPVSNDIERLVSQ
jgi:hypothetical protein